MNLEAGSRGRETVGYVTLLVLIVSGITEVTVLTGRHICLGRITSRSNGNGLDRIYLGGDEIKVARE